MGVPGLSWYPFLVLINVIINDMNYLSRWCYPVILIICTLFITSMEVLADWDDFLRILTEETDSKQSSLLTNSEIIEGLKEALYKGSNNAIDFLGRKDGFFARPEFRIPMPDTLQKIEDVLRTLKQDKLADDFVLSMNRAAEQAVPEATAIFKDAIRNMSFQDAKSILQGPDNAATQYFKRTSSDKLTGKMLPIVKQATSRVGVTAKYKSMVDGLGFMSDFVDIESLDIDRYVTDKAMRGLFKKLAHEEKLIRKDPAARTTEILKKVFGHS